MSNYSLALSLLLTPMPEAGTKKHENTGAGSQESGSGITTWYCFSAVFCIRTPVFSYKGILFANTFAREDKSVSAHFGKKAGWLP